MKSGLASFRPSSEPKARWKSVSKKKEGRESEQAREKTRLEKKETCCKGSWRLRHHRKRNWPAGERRSTESKQLQSRRLQLSRSSVVSVTSITSVGSSTSFLFDIDVFLNSQGRSRNLGIQQKKIPGTENFGIKFFRN